MGRTNEQRDRTKSGFFFTFAIVGATVVIVAAVCGAMFVMSGIGMEVLPALMP